jgi:hypothetical protein
MCQFLKNRNICLSHNFVFSLLSDTVYLLDKTWISLIMQFSIVDKLFSYVPVTIRTITKYIM